MRSVLGSLIEKGEKQSDLAKVYQVTRAAICYINKHREEIISLVERLAFLQAEHTHREIMCPSNRYTEEPKNASVGRFFGGIFKNHPYRYSYQNRSHLAPSRYGPKIQLSDVQMVHEVRTRSMLVQVTILRSRTKNNHEFKHADDRAMTILLEEALSLVGGYKDHHFSTWSRDCFAGYPMDRLFYAVGVEHENFPLLSILRSLEPCSQSGYICDYCITSDLKTKISNKFETICLPHEIASFRTVFLLLDGLTMGTTVISVFKLLLEFHVKVDRIVIDTLISSIIGIENICNVFPHAQIVTGVIDPELNEKK